MANIVAIVGRPNVGKSTFFNRLIGERKAIMDNESGVTRDRHYGYADWCGKNFTVIDTGGYVTNSDDIFEEAIREQVQLAIDEATVILFMVDVTAGVTGLDKEFANVLRRTKKPIYIVANKADTGAKGALHGEFYGLGFDEIFPISSQSGSGTGELLDEVIKHMDDSHLENPEEGIPRLAIVGRPNVGKSSLINALLGKERSIVTNIAGTTRDTINTRYRMYDKDFILVDTAGIRKKKKVNEDIEFYSVLRSIKALEAADICVLLIDATQGIEGQDLNILRIAQKHNKGMVILVNKWDLVPDKTTNSTRDFEQDIRSKIAPHNYIPVMFISALTKQRIFQAMEKAIEVYHNRSTRISTSKLNEAMLPEIEKYPPPSVKGRYVHIKYITQLPTKTPTFAFFCSQPNYVRDNYVRFLENKLRMHFPLDGVPVNVIFKQK